MVEYIEIPPQEPAKQITARHVAHHLGEHLAGFLAANNLSSWAAEDDHVLREDRLSDQILMVSQCTGLSVLGESGQEKPKAPYLERRCCR